MRVPRLRFTMRRLMVAVALLSLLLGLVARRQRLLRLSTYHAEQSYRTMIVQQSNLPAAVDSFGGQEPGAYLFPTPRSEWHTRMSMKYEVAASHPWLPVDPDSPPPEP
jgi:hypothetical protein